ncbi:MAG: hypothetical protein J7K68_03915 [Candidatus Diapherotrites archaeon]|nr:hypothetical protein [Candidatus Diapherotrites archaeon]
MKLIVLLLVCALLLTLGCVEVTEETPLNETNVSVEETTGIPTPTPEMWNETAEPPELPF